MRGGFEVDHELGQLAAHALARAQEEGNAFPAPVVDHQLERGEGVAGRSGPNAGLFAIAAKGLARDFAASVLSAHRDLGHFFVGDGAHRFEHLALFAAQI